MNRALGIPLPLWAALAASGCLDEGGPGPEISAVVPERAAPGARVALEGRGFGAGAGPRDAVAVGGRPLGATRWAAERIEVRLPHDLPGGDTWIVVTRDGRPSAPAALYVDGPRRPGTGGRRFPDGGVGRTPDGGVPLEDAGRLPDAAPREDLAARFTPDPLGEGDVRLVPLDAPPGELHLAVDLPAPAALAAWGVAFHVTWDRNLLALLEVREAGARGDPQTVAGEITPGRFAFGRVFPGGLPARSQRLCVLRLALRGRGEGRIELPARYRTVRDTENRPRAGIGWGGGSVRIGDAP